MDNIPHLRQWLVESDINTIDAALAISAVIFVLISHSPLAVIAVTVAYIIGHKHGKQETFSSGREAAYREGIKEGLKQGTRHANEAKLQSILVLIAIVFVVGLWVGFKAGKFIFQR
jgi:hypothetical protein